MNRETPLAYISNSPISTGGSLTDILIELNAEDFSFQGFEKKIKPPIIAYLRDHNFSEEQIKRVLSVEYGLGYHFTKNKLADYENKGYQVKEIVNNFLSNLEKQIDEAGSSSTAEAITVDSLVQGEEPNLIETSTDVTTELPAVESTASDGSIEQIPATQNEMQERLVQIGTELDGLIDDVTVPLRKKLDENNPTHKLLLNSYKSLKLHFGSFALLEGQLAHSLQQSTEESVLQKQLAKVEKKAEFIKQQIAEMVEQAKALGIGEESSDDEKDTNDVEDWRNAPILDAEVVLSFANEARQTADELVHEWTEFTNSRSVSEDIQQQFETGIKQLRDIAGRDQAILTVLGTKAATEKYSQFVQDYRVTESKLRQLLVNTENPVIVSNYEESKPTETYVSYGDGIGEFPSFANLDDLDKQFTSYNEVNKIVFEELKLRQQNVENLHARLQQEISAALAKLRPYVTDSEAGLGGYYLALETIQSNVNRITIPPLLLASDSVLVDPAILEESKNKIDAFAHDVEGNQTQFADWKRSSGIDDLPDLPKPEPEPNVDPDVPTPKPADDEQRRLEQRRYQLEQVLRSYNELRDIQVRKAHFDALSSTNQAHLNRTENMSDALSDSIESAEKKYQADIEKYLSLGGTQDQLPQEEVEKKNSRKSRFVTGFALALGLGALYGASDQDGKETHIVPPLNGLQMGPVTSESASVPPMNGLNVPPRRPVPFVGADEGSYPWVSNYATYGSVTNERPNPTRLTPEQINQLRGFGVDVDDSGYVTPEQIETIMRLNILTPEQTRILQGLSDVPVSTGENIVVSGTPADGSQMEDPAQYQPNIPNAFNISALVSPTEERPLSEIYASDVPPDRTLPVKLENPIANTDSSENHVRRLIDGRAEPAFREETQSLLDQYKHLPPRLVERLFNEQLARLLNDPTSIGLSSDTDYRKLKSGTEVDFTQLYEALERNLSGVDIAQSKTPYPEVTPRPDQMLPDLMSEYFQKYLPGFSDLSPELQQSIILDIVQQVRDSNELQNESRLFAGVDRIFDDQSYKFEVLARIGGEMIQQRTTAYNAPLQGELVSAQVMTERSTIEVMNTRETIETDNNTEVVDDRPVETETVPSLDDSSRTVVVESGVDVNKFYTQYIERTFGVDINPTERQSSWFDNLFSTSVADIKYEQLQTLLGMTVGEIRKVALETSPDSRLQELKALDLDPVQFDTAVDQLSKARKRLGDSIVDTLPFETVMRLLSRDEQQKINPKS